MYVTFNVVKFRDSLHYLVFRKGQKAQRLGLFPSSLKRSGDAFSVGSVRKRYPQALDLCGSVMNRRVCGVRIHVPCLFVCLRALDN
jgi:hypothetical protein